MTTGRRQRTATPRLLGSYPVPTLHLVGADVPPGPRAPSRWQPAPPPPQHGVDYAFARRHGLTPVRWRPGIVITVRLTSQVGSRHAVRVAAEAVDAVLAELRELTGLDLQGGPPLARPIDIRRVPDQEIHVAYLPMAQARQARRLAGDWIPGGAMPARDGAWYRRGWAIVATDLAISRPRRPIRLPCPSPDSRFSVISSATRSASGMQPAARCSCTSGFRWISTATAAATGTG